MLRYILIKYNGDILLNYKYANIFFHIVSDILLVYNVIFFADYRDRCIKSKVITARGERNMENKFLYFKSFTFPMSLLCTVLKLYCGWAVSS